MLVSVTSGMTSRSREHLEKAITNNYELIVQFERLVSESRTSSSLEPGSAIETAVRELWISKTHSLVEL